MLNMPENFVNEDEVDEFLMQNNLYEQIAHLVGDDEELFKEKKVFF